MDKFKQGDPVLLRNNYNQAAKSCEVSDETAKPDTTIQPGANTSQSRPINVEFRDPVLFINKY